MNINFQWLFWLTHCKFYNCPVNTHVEQPYGINIVNVRIKAQNEYLTKTIIVLIHECNCETCTINTLKLIKLREGSNFQSNLILSWVVVFALTLFIHPNYRYNRLIDFNGLSTRPGIILCLEVRESYTFYIYIHIFSRLRFSTWLWYQVFLSNANDLQTDLFEHYIGS